MLKTYNRMSVAIPCIQAQPVKSWGRIYTCSVVNCAKHWKRMCMLTYACRFASEQQSRAWFVQHVMLCSTMSCYCTFHMRMKGCRHDTIWGDDFLNLWTLDAMAFQLFCRITRLTEHILSSGWSQGQIVSRILIIHFYLGNLIDWCSYGKVTP